MAWGSAVAATQLTNITVEQYFSFGGSTNVTLNPGESCHLQVRCDFPASPTDHLLISVYASPNDGTNYDVTPYMQYLLDKASDPNGLSVLITGIKSFRVGVRRTGSTDTITSADATIRKDGVSI